MRDFPDFVEICPVCQHSVVLPDISFISLSIGSYLELAIFGEDLPSVASVNVRISWVFYFVFICSGYKLNSPHYVMGGRPRPVVTGGFPDFPKSRYSPRMLVCWIQWGRERRIEAIRYRRRLKIFEDFLFLIIKNNIIIIIKTFPESYSPWKFILGNNFVNFKRSNLLRWRNMCTNHEIPLISNLAWWRHQSRDYAQKRLFSLLWKQVFIKAKPRNVVRSKLLLLFRNGH